MTSPVSAIEAIEKAMEGVTHTDAPEWIAVAQDGNGPNGGFWTCAAATTESPRYIRADIYAALARQAEALKAALTEVLERDSQFSLSGMQNDCACIGLSRQGEREYETGTCPHQRARALLGGSEHAE
ncbi:hypothetical protein [Shinella zoogloeoides]|uniref:hypothetical protein n=1 Tax=Shinella zoogloeoides TaxID=352475 RepID=UPI0028B083D6|nr:hypothetical protein [Shinella zoogloeoides]